jgi:two-component system, OmpR family, phosphate regulon sensor histidine kinase PhoR
MTSKRSVGGFAARETHRATRAFWIFVAVAVVSVAQVSWWIVYQIRQADRLAELRQAELDLRGLQVTAALNEKFAKLWHEIDEMVADSAWKGAVPHELTNHPLVRSVSRFPAIRWRTQSSFGQYGVDNWTWTFFGLRDTIWVTINPAAAAAAAEALDPRFDFRGAAPFPGDLAFPLDPPPVLPKVEVMEQLARDRHRVIVMFASEGTFFLLLTLVGVYLIYRTIRKSAELGRRQHNFVAAVTHELKAPLASVKLYAETLLRPEIQAPQQKEFLERMLQDVSRLEHLIDNTLMAGRLEEKGFHLDLKPADLSVAVSEYERGLRGYLERHHFVLSSHIEPGLRSVFDYDAMRRVVDSLVENAVKYSGDSGHGELSLRRDGDHAVLEITDHGTGIPADQLDRVFNAFYRVGDEMTRQIKGTGLGLFLVREIVAAHGGEVELTSDGPGKGTTVRVELRAIP